MCGIGFPLNINEHNVDCFLEIPASGIFLQIGKHKKHVKQIAFDYAGECLSPLQRLDNWVLTISQSLAGFQSSHLIWVSDPTLWSLKGTAFVAPRMCVA